MDSHILPGVKAEEVAEAHLKDLAIQHEHGCNCITYWIDEKRGNVFCLIEAPSKEAVEVLHSHSHGLVPNKVIEVDSGIVESFLGRIKDPEDATVSDDGLKVFSDPSFRILMLARINDPVLLYHLLGKEKTDELLKQYHLVIKENLKTFAGTEIEHEGGNIIASFTSAAKAIACSFSVQKQLSHLNDAGLRIAVSAGEPVTKNDKIFGEAIQTAERMCSIAKDFQVVVSAAVSELISKGQLNSNDENFITLSLTDEEVLATLFSKLEENWQNAEFNVTDYCASIAMSKSQLYRKTVALSGLSPNLLLKEFRLENARELLKKKNYNITEITFNSGFTSPSYFTKCFKKKFGLTPMSYLDLV